MTGEIFAGEANRHGRGCSLPPSTSVFHNPTDVPLCMPFGASL